MELETGCKNYVVWISVPFEALRHQMCLVGVHDEGELIDEVLWLNETLEPAHHGHPAVLQHYHGQERVGVLPQSLRHWNTIQTSDSCTVNFIHLIRGSSHILIMQQKKLSHNTLHPHQKQLKWIELCHAVISITQISFISLYRGNYSILDRELNPGMQTRQMVILFSP